MEYPVELRETVIKKVLTSNETQDSVAEELSPLRKVPRTYDSGAASGKIELNQHVSS